jgi:hypothetical protein
MGYLSPPQPGEPLATHHTAVASEDPASARRQEAKKCINDALLEESLQGGQKDSERVKNTGVEISRMRSKIWHFSPSEPGASPQQPGAAAPPAAERTSRLVEPCAPGWSIFPEIRIFW